MHVVAWIRILAPVTKEDVTWNKQLHIKMFKTALFDCAIKEKCFSVDGGPGIWPLFSSPPRGIWQLRSPHPREFAIQGKKMLMTGGYGRSRNWLMHNHHPLSKTLKSRLTQVYATRTAGRNSDRTWGGGEDTLGISGWRCAAGTLEPLTNTRASSADYC